MAQIGPAAMLAGYSRGIFPMAEARGSPVLHWVEPRLRGVIPLDRFHVSRSLARAIRKGDYRITTDRDFDAVVAACADRPETWINADLHSLYAALHALGHAHSLEIWREDRLIGGVFGVTLGRAFCGETMFSRERDASKIALAYLVDRLRRAGFILFDTQFLTPHLASLGAVEMSQRAYLGRLAVALEGAADFTAPPIPQPSELLSSAGSSGSASGRMQDRIQTS
jgi:leucyl/phenylalanyl-tRNA--protein transferase